MGRRFLRSLKARKRSSNAFFLVYLKNKDIICLTIIVIVAMIAISSIIKINKTHEDNLMIVSEKRITEAA